MQKIISEFYFKNSDGDYLDVSVDNIDKYITIKTETTGEFTFNNELEVDILCQELKKIFKTFNGVNTHEVDMRIPEVSC